MSQYGLGNQLVTSSILVARTLSFQTISHPTRCLLPRSLHSQVPPPHLTTFTPNLDEFTDLQMDTHVSSADQADHLIVDVLADCGFSMLSTTVDVNDALTDRK